jgi:hypothetical protein
MILEGFGFVAFFVCVKAKGTKKDINIKRETKRE